jgi:hypothetical protein
MGASPRARRATALKRASTGPVTVWRGGDGSPREMSNKLRPWEQHVKLPQNVVLPQNVAPEHTDGGACRRHVFSDERGVREGASRRCP